jgi:hypothetical protein
MVQKIFPAPAIKAGVFEDGKRGRFVETRRLRKGPAHRRDIGPSRPTKEFRNIVRRERSFTCGNDHMASRGHMYPSVTSALLVCTVVLCLVGSSQLAEARCKRARPDEVPHGANEFHLLAEQEVRQIGGSVSSLGDSEFAEDVVVEVYNYEGNDSYEAVSEALKGRRIAACVTGSDGRFSFSGLKPGRYLLHLGMRDMRGINKENAILHVTPRGNRERLEIRLTLGT